METKSFIRNYKLKLQLLIDGYIKLSQDAEMSSDIIQLISLYYGGTNIAFLLVTKWHARSSKIMELIDIDSKKCYETNLYFTGFENGFSPLFYRQLHSYCIAQNSILPDTMKQECKNKYSNKLTSESLFSSNHWNLIFQFGPICHITALHPRFYRYGSDPLMYLGYNFKIPSLKCLPISSSIYSKTAHTLYSFEQQTIYSLDFHENSGNEWRWQIWKGHMDITIERGASICMVDNDKFVACINAKGRNSYLFAMNETKLAIRLADASVNRCYAVSLYHDIYHKIITADAYGVEWYDINKDKSMIIVTYKEEHEASNIWFSPFDPNILHIATEESIVAIDLRNRTYEEEFIYSPSKVDISNHCNSAYLRF